MLPLNPGIYRLQLSTYVVSWSTSFAQVSISTSNVNPGDTQNFILNGLAGGTTYYFRMWTGDEMHNWSGISNAATTWAQLYPIPPPRYDFEGVTHGWTNAKDDGWGSTWHGITGQISSSDRAYRGGYSLKCTAEFTSDTTDGGYVFIKDPAGLPLFDECPTSAWVFVPAGAPAMNARIHIQNSTWTSITGPWISLTIGGWTKITYTPTDATNIPYKRFGVQISNPATAWSGFIYVDVADWVQFDFEGTAQGWTNSSTWGAADAGITAQSASCDFAQRGAFSLKGTCNFNSTNWKRSIVY